MLPRDPVFGPADPEIRTTVMELMPEVVAVEQLRLESSGRDSARFFRAACRHNRPPLFLKLMTESECGVFDETEAILERLPPECAAVRACGVFRPGGAVGRVIVAYPYLEARYPSPVTPDLAALGRSIAALHDGLSRSQDRSKIEARGRERARWLDAVLRNSNRHRSLLDAAEIPPLTACVAQAMESAAGQVLHGDLNVGNILCERESGRIHFLDFEDVRHSFGPPILDLALTVERLCLLLDDEATAVSAARDLLRSYAAARGVSPIERAGALALALRAINERAVGVLIASHEAGLESAQQEWGKFGALLRRHEEHRAAIAEIERAFL